MAQYTNPVMEHYDCRNSPFLDLRSPFTAWEKVKMALLIVTVIPRVLLAFLALSCMALLSTLATLHWPLDKPLPPMRRKIVLWSRHFSMVCVWLMGFWVRCHGWENVAEAEKKNVRLIMFNHVSYVDSFILVGYFAPAGLSKASNAGYPIIGRCIRSLQNIYLPDARQVKDGKNGTGVSKAESVSEQITRRVTDLRYPMLAVAPEGTCGDGRCILQFRTGSFVAGAPVLPVLFKYSNNGINPAWGVVNMGLHVLRVLCQFYNSVDVHILPPYMPSEAEKKDPALYASNVRTLMASHLDVPMVEHMYNHYYALCKLDINVATDGTSLTAPPGVLDAEGFADLTTVLKKKE
ncbi:unnamed protein product [Ostreobium quekettii]|uniref:Phospholipid/glycerol acyltransferase domain-containing protein n=1 Tax=Ostreobium quekettii TaxID=121088 RepID=A0A8S1J088_9CHLO|nr:unnamed protein product [Ostreobium quekettii]|eukprot:evm.model.scf_495.6 EVM.evm.TU.scf_495.6   scf_495:76467-81102(-)